MKIVVPLLGALLAAPVVTSSAETQPRPAIADFALQVDHIFPSLSPDGTKVAFVQRTQDTRLLTVVDLAKKERRALMPAISDNFEITYCRFKNDERLVCGFRGTDHFRGNPYPISRLVAVDVAGKDKPKVLVQNGNHGNSQFQDRVLDWQLDDPKRVLIALSTDGGPYTTVQSLDVYTGLTHTVQRSRASITQWYADRAGIVRFGTGFDGRKYSYIARASAEAPWQTLAKWEIGQAEFETIGFGAVPGTLLVRAIHNGRDAIFEMDLGEKSDRQLLFANQEVDVDDEIRWPVDGRIVGFDYETDRTHRLFIDDEAESFYREIDQLLPGAENHVASASRDGKRFLIVSHRDVRPADYHLLDLTTNKLLKVGSANPALSKFTLAEMKPLKIKLADGVVLPGYLTLPRGSSGKKVPMVVYPHGGPHARDSWGFDPVVQFLASRGYAVLQMNFRGSTGYGHEWYEAGLRNWGTVMVDDVIAATKWAIAEGIADPAHTSIVGWSFGGYAALMASVREPDLYRSVTSIAGVTDLRALAADERQRWGGRARMEYMLGDDTSELKAGSPTRNAEKLKAPVLLIHGEDDWQVGVDQSRRMEKALKGAGKKVEYHQIAQANHSLTRYEWRELLYTKLEAFLAANN
jgi:dipeptidyl aminopeptidase/acylaminoacyl peptidase